MPVAPPVRPKPPRERIDTGAKMGSSPPKGKRKEPVEGELVKEPAKAQAKLVIKEPPKEPAKPTKARLERFAL